VPSETLVMDKVIEPGLVVVVLEPVPVPVSAPLPQAIIQQRSVREISRPKTRENFAHVDFIVLFSLLIGNR
jgi:hypothetical protein